MNKILSLAAVKHIECDPKANGASAARCKRLAEARRFQ
jgi:hypothetical protein